MASAASLPELTAGLGPVAIVKAPGLTPGDIVGSCVFNLRMLSVLDTRTKKPLIANVKSGHIVAAIFGEKLNQAK